MVEVPPELPLPMEPWEVARGLAERQAAAAEEVAGPATGSPDVSGGVDLW